MKLAAAFLIGFTLGYWWNRGRTMVPAEYGAWRTARDLADEIQVDPYQWSVSGT